MSGGAYFPPIGADPDDLPPQGWATQLGDLIPLLRRVELLDAERPVRIRVEPGGESAPSSASAFIALPFGVLISRTLPWDERAHPVMDRTVRLPELIAYLLGEGPEPAARDELWRGGLPPVRGWTRLDTLPDDVVRERVRVGATAVKELTDQAGDGEQVRQVAIDALLDSVVLTVTAGTGADPASGTGGGNAAAAIPLRTLSALTRMGFVRRESSVGVDVARGWVRVAAAFGSAYAAAGPAAARGGGLGMLPVMR